LKLPMGKIRAKTEELYRHPLMSGAIITSIDALHVFMDAARARHCPEDRFRDRLAGGDPGGHAPNCAQCMYLSKSAYGGGSGRGKLRVAP